MPRVRRRHVVKLANGDKVVIVGDDVFVHLSKPIKYRREHWIKYLLPHEEVRRTILGIDEKRIVDALEFAFTVVPQKVYRENGDD